MTPRRQREGAACDAECDRVDFGRMPVATV